MSSVAADIGITITARDATTSGFATASKGAELLEKKFKGLGGQLNAMPGQFSKMSGAMTVFGGAVGQIGGAIGGALGKLSGFASLLLGGPVGIAIAALTAAVGLLSAAFGESTEEMEKAEAAAKKYRDELERLRSTNTKLADEVKSLKLDAAFVGAAPGMREFADVQMAIIEQNDKLSKMRRDPTVTNEMLAAEEGHLLLLHQKSGALSELIRREDENKRATEAAEEAKRTARAKSEEALRKAEQAAKQAQQKELEDALKRIDTKHQHRLAVIQREADAELESARYVDEQLRAMDEEKAARAQAVADVIEGLSGYLTDVLIADSEKARRAAVKNAIAGALAQIAAAAAKGAADAFAEHQKLGPIVGPIVGAIASAVVFAGIMAFRAKVVGAASGGLITGGVAGRDSVPAMLMPGEIVMPAPVARQFQRMAEGRGDFGPGAGGGQSSVVTNNNYRVTVTTLDPSSVNETQLAKMAVKIGNEIEKYKARGLVRRRE